VHGNARLTPWGRHELVCRIASGRPVAHVAAEMGVSRMTAYKWWRRWQTEGLAGLADRSSRPRSCPHRTPQRLVRRIELLRRREKLGPLRIAYRLGVAASTVQRVLARLGLGRLAWMDRPTGRVIRRYERPAPGDLVHVDVKKLGRIPEGGGWRITGRGEGYRDTGARKRLRLGLGCVHAAVDDHSRLAYAEVLDDEQAPTCAAFWSRAATFFAGHGVQVRQVMTDNAWAYKSHAFAAALGSAEHIFIRPRRPQTNGKVERFNRTLLEEWAYVRPYRSESQRVRALDPWLHLYNHHRSHTSLRGAAPVDCVSDLPGHYS